MILRCADCSGEVRMIRVMRDYLRLGHVHQPPTLHPVRVFQTDAAQSAMQSVIEERVRLARTAAERPSEGLEDSRRSSEGPNAGLSRGPSPGPSLPRGPRRARRAHGGSSTQPSTGAVEQGTPHHAPAPVGAGRRST